MAQIPSKRVLIVCGETSGDMHAATLVRSLRAMQGDIGLSFDVMAMGGKALEAEEVSLLVDIRDSANVMGIVEVVSSLGNIFASLRKLKHTLRTWKPDLLILIDFPDFNLRLAKVARQLDIPTLYYIPPKVWAWRSGRVKYLKRDIDFIATIYPFEVEFYQQHGIRNVQFVGHPFATTPELDKGSVGYASWARQEGLDSFSPLVALFVGSRKAEVRLHLPIVLEAFKRLVAEYPNACGLLPVPPGISVEELNAQIPSDLNVRVYREASRSVLANCDVGILKSGTCNLEAAFLDLPFVCIYKTSWFSYELAKRFVKLKEVSPVNLIKSATVKELIQDGLSGEAIYAEVSRILKDQSYCERMLDSYKEIRTALGTEAPASDKLAFVASRMVLGKSIEQ